MTELYIIAGIIGYLLVGTVFVGLCERARGDGDGEGLMLPILLWPLVLLVVGPLLFIESLLWIAKKIGGVK